MATIVLTPSGTYKALVRMRGWPTTSKTFRLKRDAVDWARRTEDEMVRGVYISRTGSERMTLQEALHRYLAEVTPTKKPTTQRSEKITAQHLIGYLGKYSMAALSSELVASYRDNRLSAGKSNNTVRIELAMLSNLFTIAIQEWGLGLTHNPVAAIRKPSPGQGRDRRLTDDEEQRLFEAVEAHSNPLLAWVVRIAIETGMRQSEILGLRLSQVDLNSRVVRLSDTKNNSARTVPLSAAATATFKSALENPLRPKETDLVFFGEPGRDGKRWPYQFAKIWGEVKKAIGVGDLHFHDLRHEAVSRLVENGLSDQEVASISGHKSMQMLRRYTHLRAEDLVSRLDGLEKTRAVVFDVYGTLVSIGKKRMPFAKLLQIGEAKGRAKTSADRHRLMASSLSLAEAATQLQIGLTAAELDELEKDLKTELESITSYPEVARTIQTLQKRGIKVGICSNLAAAYAPPVEALLPMKLDAYSWSFRVGALKPEARIYRTCQKFCVRGQNS
ncbi:tyrosine-type recombinase/integrase [Massilia alkalitolerans]|uniref:tyrosine-type recombinase/integrase n=1 Tax=Massilia alkalitolerans TaxID=286638 RepID=UPI00351D6B40